MDIMRIVCVIAAALALTLTLTRAQEAEDRTLLTWDQMRAIVNEASGERAMHHVLELVPYPRVRDRSEYTGHFRETEVMARFAREYGYAGVEIESFPAPQPTWHASRAELWMVEPQVRKLYDVHDVAISIGSGSESGDVTAPLVDAGAGARAEDFEGREVKGKIVLGAAPLGTLHRLAVRERGAAGVVSYNSLRPDDRPDQILSQGLGGGGGGQAQQAPPRGFGWAIAPRIGRELAARLARGEAVRLRSIVESATFPGEMEVVHATIPSDGSSTQEIIVSAHLYEGYQKQGANDDNSGCAMTLELGRTLLRLIGEGKLPKPKRTIHFLWVPEISGTTAWLRKHDDVKARLVANLNFDMEGIALRGGNATWVLHRTPDTFPSFLNDLCASFLEFVADLNRERVRYRHHGYAFTLPIVSPNGTRDQFNVKVEKHYGASDHVVYLGQGIPAVIFVTWPDPSYHSSEDTPDKLDPTQFKRATVVGAAAAIVLAAADDQMAAKVAAESLARGAARMGEAERKGLSYLADTTRAADLSVSYREALNAVRHQAAIEKAVVQSASVLFSRPDAAAKSLASFDPLIAARAAALENEVRAFYRVAADQRAATAAEPKPTPLEEEASQLVPERVGGAAGGGFGGLQAPPSASADARAAAQAALEKIPQHMRSELTALVQQKKTVLEIRDFLSAEFEPLSLSDLMEYFKALEKAGGVTLTKR
jgi:hypothetical protein